MGQKSFTMPIGRRSLCEKKREFGKLTVIPQKVYGGTDTDKHGARLDVYLEEELESGVLPERAEAEVLVTFKGPKLDSAAKIRKELELPLSIAAQLPPERFPGVSIFPDVSADFSSAEFRGVCPPCDSNESSFSGVSSPRDLWGLLDTLDETSSYFSWKELLELLGFSAVHDVRKVRSKAYWEWEGCRVEISFDQIAGLGTYAELEFIARDKSEIPAVRGRLLALSEFLRLTDIEPRSYLALVIEAEK